MQAVQDKYRCACDSYGRYSTIAITDTILAYQSVGITITTGVTNSAMLKGYHLGPGSAATDAGKVYLPIVVK